MAKTCEKAKKKTRGQKKKESYSTYILQVLKKVHPGFEISGQSMTIMNSFLNDMFERIAAEASQLAKLNNSKTLKSSEIQSAVRLILTGELACHAVANGTQAIIKDCSGK